MRNWIVTSVTTLGDTSVEGVSDFAEAQTLFEEQKKSFAITYVQIVDLSEKRVRAQWVAQYFGVELEIDS